MSHFRVVEGVLPEWKERGKDTYEFGRHCLRAGMKRDGKGRGMEDNKKWCNLWQKVEME